MFITKKKIHGKEYYYLRESKRQGKKVVAKTIAYLGKTKKQAYEKYKSVIENMGKVKKQEIHIKKMDKENKVVEINEEKEFLSFIQDKGLIWGPSPEIYGGLAGFYTYGPVGKLLKNKVENSVRKIFNANGLRELEGPTVLPDVVWKA
ncbi:MAG: hypothetical protein KJ559_00465, partial [Nanoarchaeota archaeon]|nr:hypothetical protein [Nanoarchaeota archaeon]